MSRRVVIVTELIAPYRIPVFNALAQRSGIDLHVIFLSETDYSQWQWLVYKDEIRFSYEVLSSWRRRLGRQSVLLNWGTERALRQRALTSLSVAAITMLPPGNPCHGRAEMEWLSVYGAKVQVETFADAIPS